MNKIKNTIKGGIAIPINKKYFLMKGRRHEQGGIKLGNNIEVENGEILKIEPKGIKVLSNANILGGISPAEYALGGLQTGTFENKFNNAFKYQEKFKDVNNLNDDGTKIKTSNKHKYRLGTDDKNNNNTKTISPEDIKLRQGWAESQFNANAVSPRGARGVYQIMPATEQEYVEMTSNVGDIYDKSYNEAIRDWQLDRLMQSRTITNGNPTEEVLNAKLYAAYNYGQGNLGNALVKAKNDGIDIYNTLDWLNTIYLPKETVDYVKFVVFGEDTGGIRTMEQFNNYMNNTNKRKLGGNIPSTGKIKKANLGLYFKSHPQTVPNLINAGTQVIASGISYGLNRNMLNNLEYISKPQILQPVKYITDIDISAQENNLKRTIKKYNDWINKNTASSQTAYGRNLLNNENYIEKYNELKQREREAEASLINQDIAQQQNTVKYNLENYNNWLKGKYDFKNNIRQLQGENNQALIQNTSAAIMDFFNKQNYWENTMMNANAIMLANPSITPKYLAERGMPIFQDWKSWLNNNNTRIENRKQKE